MGKALLAFGDQEPEIATRELGELERFTSHTLTTPAELVTELRTAREQGWAVNREERYDGVVGVAAPVIVPGRGVVAAIGVQGPTARLQRPDELSLTRPRRADGGSRRGASADRHGLAPLRRAR